MFMYILLYGSVTDNDVIFLEGEVTSRTARV